MTAPKFTPGPWSVDPNGELPDRPYMVGKALYCVADVGNIDDARLIASAPALYAALEGCEKALADALDGKRDIILSPEDALSEARAALALARGEEKGGE